MAMKGEKTSATVRYWTPFVRLCTGFLSCFFDKILKNSHLAAVARPLFEFGRLATTDSQAL
jgi:hypothetical protein